MLFIKSILLLCTATFVLARHDQENLISVARLTGKDTTTRGKRGAEIFRNPRNHASAVASILLYTADRNDYRPREKGIITDSTVYEKFMDETLSFPGYRVGTERIDNLHFNGDRKQFHEQIRQHYRSDVNKADQVARAFEKMIPRELDEDNEDQSNKYLLTQLIIHNHMGRPIQVEMSELSLTLSRDRDGRAKIDKQTALMYVNHFTVKTDYLVNHADSLAKDIPTVMVKKALEELSTNGWDEDEDNEDEDEDDLVMWFSSSASTCAKDTRQRLQHRL
ncbi:hypothetical protein EDD11_004684 [Mortierella claussenii]|nr:hypothetical protein EDD11_004684 [Mortierella claussenii]